MSAMTTPLPSNSVGAARGDGGSARRCASGVAVACRVAVRSLKGAVWSNVAAADCGTSRYSAESTDGLAGNVTHPPSDAGSIDAYAPTASVSCDARAELHVGALGPVASWPHAATASSAPVASRFAVRRLIPTSHSTDSVTILKTLIPRPSRPGVHQVPQRDRAHQHDPVHA